MKKLLFCFLFFSSVVHAESDLNVSMEKKWMSGWRKYSKILSIQADNSVNIIDVKINNGRCNFPMQYRLPFEIKYGRTMNLHVDLCDVHEVSVTTNSGTSKFKF